MAQRVEVVLEDDLEGGPAQETIRFSLDDRHYEIDLSTANAQKLREALLPHVEAGRTATRASPRSTGRPTSRSNPDTARIRAWATENGYAVSDRGRIHQHIREAYYTAH